MSKTVQHTVPDGTSPQRLDRYLVSILKGQSRAQIQRLIAEGQVRLAGSKPEKLKPSHAVAPGERLEIDLIAAPEQVLKPEAMSLVILHEDNHLIVLDKPAGLVVHPAPGNPSGTLVNALISRKTALSTVSGVERPGIVHRLDKDTSGVMVVAKDDATHQALSDQFAQGDVRRVYLALVQGVIQQDEGTIEAPIGRHPTHRQKMAVRYGASRQARTRYRVKARYAKATFLELYPQTGRTHQLRVHLKHIGHPILGDVRYGIRAGLNRQALHAHQLEFEHPATHGRKTFTSPWPKELEAARQDLNRT